MLPIRVFHAVPEPSFSGRLNPPWSLQLSPDHSLNFFTYTKEKLSEKIEGPLFFVFAIEFEVQNPVGFPDLEPDDVDEDNNTHPEPGDEDINRGPLFDILGGRDDFIELSRDGGRFVFCLRRLGRSLDGFILFLRDRLYGCCNKCQKGAHA